MGRLGILTLLSGSAVALAVAPRFMPPSYSWVLHSVSESGAQGVPNAWIARTGFLLLGFAVLWLAADARRAWGRAGRLCHQVYGVAMIAVAAYSHAPWLAGPSDGFEDTLHSVAATGMGFAFTAGVLLVGLRQGRERGRPRGRDLLAMLAATLIPLFMVVREDIAGLVQRVMFGVGYAWYAAEALGPRQAPGAQEASGPS